MTFTPAMIRAFHQAIVNQDQDFLKMWAVEVIRDGIDVVGDMSLDISEEELIEYKPDANDIKHIGMSCIMDQLVTLGEDLEKVVKATPLTFERELKMELSKVLIG